MIRRLLSRMFGEVKSGLSSIPDFLSYGEAKSGVSVNWRTALEVTTVLACVRAISEGVAQVPVRFYDGSSDQLMRLRDHPLEPVLARNPHRLQRLTGFQLRETMLMHAGLTGNAFVFKNRVGPNRRIVDLIPISPGRVTVYRKADMTLEYHVTAEVPEMSGLGQGLAQIATGEVMVFPQEAIWHFRGPSWNGWLGLEAVKLAREAIGLAIATEAAHAKLHRNGLRAGSVYSVDGKLDDEQYEKLNRWLEKTLGGENAYRNIVLDRNAKFLASGMTGVDAEHIATRKLQVEEICRAFRVMPIMVGFSDKTATYASAEQMFIQHVVHTIAPWASRFEESAMVNLLEPNDETLIKLHLNGLMRGASKDRAEYFAKALGHGGGHAWMTPNEVREEDGYDWMEGGDELPKPSAIGTDIAPDPGENAPVDPGVSKDA
jgi:HK97 family phage portal protein